MGKRESKSSKSKKWQEKFRTGVKISHWTKFHTSAKFLHSGVKFSHPDVKTSTFSAPLLLLLLLLISF